MKRCAICLRRIWPWQRSGFRYFEPGDIDWWHVSCWRWWRTRQLNGETPEEF